MKIVIEKFIDKIENHWNKWRIAYIATCMYIVIVAIVAGITTIFVQAEGTYKIEAGTYRFNNVLSVPSEALIIETFGWTIGNVVADGDFGFAVIPSADSGLGVAYIVPSISEAPVYIYAEGEQYESNLGFTGWADEAYKIIVIPNDTEVSEEFGIWFSSNTVRQDDPSELTIQGSYMFKNDLTSYLNTPFRIPLNFTVNTSGNTYQYIAIGSNGSGDLYYDTESGNVDWVYDELLGGWPNQDYRSINLNAPKVLTSEQYSIFKNLVVPLERVTPIRGKWVANDVLFPPSQEGIYGSTIDLKFTAYIQYASANVLCYADQITLFYTDTTVDMFYRVVNSVPDLRGYGYQLPYQMQVVDDNSFVSALGGGTKYIDFGEQEQYMPTPFYNWFTANFSPQPIYDKDQSDNIKDEINSVPKPNVGQMEDVFSPEDYFDENDPAFLANMGMFKDILGNSIMLPIVSLVVIFGVISFVIFGKRG